jgi:hypothetical protein
MRDEFRPAIEALQKDLVDLEKKVSDTKATINRLCELAGASPIYEDVTGGNESASVTSIRGDTFYGKSISTAAREYLEMRRVARLGPAPPREIYLNLLKGGLQFDTENETNAVAGVRATMRKNSAIFHRLPNGTYGLLAWYPGAKAPKNQSTQAEGEAEEEEETAEA